jgi:carbon-monoxide dehydrogenase large subunit
VNAPLETLRFGSGHQVRRIEDPALVTGAGRFTDDLQREGLLHLVFLRSPHAHARIVSIDAGGARAAAGVLLVLTGAELKAAGIGPLPGPPAHLKRPDGSPAAGPERRVMAVDTVRFVGEAVAAVVAENRKAALDACEAIAVDYEVLEAHTDARATLAAAPQNVAAQVRAGQADAVAAAFAGAAHVVELDVVNQRLAPTCMEPRVVLAEVDGERLVITLSAQMPSAVRDGIAGLLPGLKKEDVRVRVHDVGGGFGMKTGLYPEDVVTAHAARMLKRPVRWLSTRVEEFTASIHGRDLASKAALALDANGRITAYRIRSVANTGAYAAPVACAIPLIIGPWVSTSVYDVPAIDFEAQAVVTNTTPIGAYRGAGRPEAVYLIERLMDAAARTLKMDPAELRRRNLVPPDKFPYSNAMAQVYDCGAFGRMLEQCLELADWQGYARRADAVRAQGKLPGRSVTTFLEWTSGNAFTEAVTIHVLADGIIEVVSATQAMGQGIATSYAQLAVDIFGVPIDRIRIVQGDTDRANGFGSAGSRSLFTGGAAVKVAGEKTVEHAKGLAAEALEAAPADIEYRAGHFSIAGTDRGIGLFELAARQGDARITASGDATAQGPSWPNAAHVCEIEIDPDTGAIAIAAYVSVNDIGRIVSPQIVTGQLEGGAVQGIGQALCEQVVYDDSGQLLTASLMDYALPHADGFTGFVTRWDQSVPTRTNLLGAKGVGELGTIGATPALANAVVDALIAAGVARQVAESVQMPFTAAKVWAALQSR